MSEQLQTVLHRVASYKQRGDQYECRCPAHDDQHASLTVRDGDIKVLLMCHAGCSYEQICAAMNLAPSELYFEDRSQSEEPEGVYRYEDEDGNLLFEVVRFPGKQFRQRRADGQWGLSGTRRVLYNLPGVLAGIAAYRWIFVCEGEKDAQAIIKSGGVGTCNPMGAGAWRPEYASSLAGGNIRIVADRDEPGRAHANTISESLVGVVSRVEVVEPAYGKDAYEHLQAGFGLEDFQPLEQENGLILVRMSEVTPEDVHWVEGYRNLIGYKQIALLTGMPGVNKTTFACNVAASMTRRSENCLLISAEDDITVLRARVEAAGGDPNLCFGAHMRRDGLDGGLVLLPSDVAEIGKTVERRGIRLVVLDPIQAHFDPGVDSFRDQSVRNALAPLGAVARRTGCAVIIINHLTKGRELDPMRRAGGSIGIAGLSRTCLLMGMHPESHPDEGRRIVAPFKNAYGPLGASHEFRVEPASVAGYEELVIRLTYMGESRIGFKQVLAGAKEEE